MNYEILAINISLMVVFLAVWAGVPMWLVLRRPDRHPREARTMPAYLRGRTRAQVVSQAAVRGPAVASYVVNIRDLEPAGTR